MHVFWSTNIISEMIAMWNIQDIPEGK